MQPRLPEGLDGVGQPLSRELSLRLPASVLPPAALRRAEREQGPADQLHQTLHDFLDHFLHMEGQAELP